jgi:predicted DNA-binding transcriptional regulator AlpA
VRLLSHEQVNELTGKRSRIQRWRDAKADRFPPPVRDGDRKRWPDTEIESYLRWRIAVRDGETTIERWSEWWALDRQRAEEAA